MYPVKLISTAGRMASAQLFSHKDKIPPQSIPAYLNVAEMGEREDIMREEEFELVDIESVEKIHRGILEEQSKRPLVQPSTTFITLAANLVSEFEQCKQQPLAVSPADKLDALADLHAICKHKISTSQKLLHLCENVHSLNATFAEGCKRIVEEQLTKLGDECTTVSPTAYHCTIKNAMQSWCIKAQLALTSSAKALESTQRTILVLEESNLEFDKQWEHHGREAVQAVSEGQLHNFTHFTNQAERLIEQVSEGHYINFGDQINKVIKEYDNTERHITSLFATFQRKAATAGCDINTIPQFPKGQHHIQQQLSHGFFSVVNQLLPKLLDKLEELQWNTTPTIVTLVNTTTQYLHSTLCALQHELVSCGYFRTAQRRRVLEFTEKINTLLSKSTVLNSSFITNIRFDAIYSCLATLNSLFEIYGLEGISGISWGLYHNNVTHRLSHNILFYGDNFQLYLHQAWWLGTCTAACRIPQLTAFESCVNSMVDCCCCDGNSLSIPTDELTVRWLYPITNYSPTAHPHTTTQPATQVTTDYECESTIINKSKNSSLSSSSCTHSSSATTATAPTILHVAEEGQHDEDEGMTTEKLNVQATLLNIVQVGGFAVFHGSRLLGIMMIDFTPDDTSPFQFQLSDPTNIPTTTDASNYFDANSCPVTVKSLMEHGANRFSFIGTNEEPWKGTIIKNGAFGYEFTDKSRNCVLNLSNPDTIDTTSELPPIEEEMDTSNSNQDLSLSSTIDNAVTPQDNCSCTPSAPLSLEIESPNMEPAIDFESSDNKKTKLWKLLHKRTASKGGESPDKKKEPKTNKKTKGGFLLFRKKPKVKKEDTTTAPGMTGFYQESH